MNLLRDDINIPEMAARLLALAIALTIHEFAHAWTAYRAGDDTAARMGRLSLNPIDHLDLVGSLMLIFAGFGWAKPVPVNPYRFKHPRRDNIIVSAAGIVANLLLATVVGLLFRFGVVGGLSETIQMVLIYLLLINIGLAFFNLIPIPPLDGSHILAELLPVEQARSYERTVGQYGFLILILLLITGVVGELIGPPSRLFLTLVVGNLYL